MTWWRALLSGPLFPLRMHRSAWQRGGPGCRRWMRIELGLNVSVCTAAIFAPLALLRYHLLAMALGQCLSAFFCVWTVHHDCPAGGVIARTIRSRLRAIATFEMFYHLEHHLFPAVPTCHLPGLARRLDQAEPEFAALRAF